MQPNDLADCAISYDERITLTVMQIAPSDLDYFRFIIAFQIILLNVY